ncbi:hypothetical protein DA792_18825 [Celeribacter baekdonensis]|uniref:Uncharacterized protein n=2 Tax=Celeribacter baekdonensis TaxID=875171 RepID=A0A2R4M6T7_9RHOB|nr:hypothetical protein DA792_18825 [Celeribacter baekdonensis]
MNIASAFNSCITIIVGRGEAQRKWRSSEIVINLLFPLGLTLCFGEIAMQTSFAITEFQKELSGQAVSELGKEQ